MVAVTAYVSGVIRGPTNSAGRSTEVTALVIGRVTYGAAGPGHTAVVISGIPNLCRRASNASDIIVSGVAYGVAVSTYITTVISRAPDRISIKAK